MRDRIAALLFLVVLVFIAVFCWQTFNALFIKTNTQLTTSALAAFFGAFFAFLFIRIGDFFKSYFERIYKGHNSLIKIEFLLNSLLSELDDNIYIIETFEELYNNNVNNPELSRVFIWANRLTPVRTFDELLFDLLNIDLINELFTLNIHLHKINDSLETINVAYKESKDAFISRTVDSENYKNNLIRIYKDILDIKKFISATIEETAQALSAVRVLAKTRPLIVSLLRRRPSFHYGRQFKVKREKERKTLSREMDDIKRDSQSRIETIRKRE